jgi:hypothetical protein
MSDPIVITCRDQDVFLHLKSIETALKNRLHRTLTFGCHRPVSITYPDSEGLIVKCKPEDIERVMLIVEAFSEGVKAMLEVLSK